MAAGGTVSPPPAQVRVEQFGLERQPVVIIDGFSGMVPELRSGALSAEFRDPGTPYPGIRAPADPGYLGSRRDILIEVMHRVFGFDQDVKVESSAYSLVTLSPEQLSHGQRIPHHDDTAPDLIAVMHYLAGPETGGTAFYRHRRTGFETITAEREPRYNAARSADDAEFGLPAPAYHYGESDRYEMIGEVDAQPDRLILYRGQLLHSGVIPGDAELSPDPAKGRLTINMFLKGE